MPIGFGSCLLDLDRAYWISQAASQPASHDVETKHLQLSTLEIRPWFSGLAIAKIAKSLGNYQDQKIRTDHESLLEELFGKCCDEKVLGKLGSTKSGKLLRSASCLGNSYI